MPKYAGAYRVSGSRGRSREGADTPAEQEKKKYDYTMLTVILLLVGIGLILLYSTSAYNGEVKFHDSFYYLKKQGFATALGLAGMFLVAGIDYHKWMPLANLGYLAAVALSVAVMLIGDEYNGSKRWLSLGPVSFQPSEFAKVALIFFLACLVSGNVKTMGKMRTLLKVMIPVLPIVALVGASNLSTAIIILGIAAVLIFVASPKYAQFIFMGVAAVGFMGVFLALESYRLERLAIWRHPEQYEKGYQTLQGLYAIGSGGLFGRGLGESVQKLGFLPEAQNDMIFSIICEELGLVGASFIVLLFLILIWRLFVIATHAKDLLGFRRYGTYDDSGDFKYCGCHKYHSEYRNYVAVYQLRGNLGAVFAAGNGACTKCVKSGKIKRTDSGNRGNN